MKEFKSKVRIDMNDWIDALKEQSCVAGVSSRELAETWGVSLTVANKRITMLFGRGKIGLAGKRRVPKVDGVMCSVPVYSLVNKH